MSNTFTFTDEYVLKNISLNATDGEGCENCIWIEESAHAMSEYGTPVKKYKVDMPTKAEESNNKNKHPLYDLIMEKFCK